MNIGNKIKPKTPKNDVGSFQKLNKTKKLCFYCQYL